MPSRPVIPQHTDVAADGPEGYKHPEVRDTHRPRLEEVFGMEYRIEAYTPKAQRHYGYFAMPVLVGDEIVARVDPKRNGKTLTINRVVFESAKPTDLHLDGAAKAILRAATWVNCDKVEITDVIPKGLHKKLNQLVS